MIKNSLPPLFFFLLIFGVSQLTLSQDDSVEFPTPELEQSAEIAVPEKYEKIWPVVAPFYESIVLDQVDEGDREMSQILPDSIKHPLLTPVCFILGMIGVFVGSIWFLVKEFQVSLGWGFGQLGANLASCILVIPGTIVAIIFLCMHWRAGRVPFFVSLISWAICILGYFFVPSWVFETK